MPSVSESSGLRGLTSLRQLRIRALVVAALLAPWRPAAAVLAEPPAGYVHRAWTARDGLPVDGLTDLLQTRDGYLWIATWDGLVRFDGVRFVRFHMGNTDALPSNRVTRLVELPDGRLLVRTAVPTAVVEHRAGRFARLEGALASVSGPRDTSRRGAEGWSVAGTSVRRDGREVLRTTSRILRHLVDREGNLWLATLSSGLHRLRRAQVGMVELPGDAQQRRAQSVWEDRAGGVSIATTAGGVYRLADGRLTRVADTHSLAWLGGDAMGRVWIAADVIAGVGAPLDAATRAALAAERRRDFHGMFEDRRGARWLPAVSGGISRLADGRWAHFGEAEGIPRRVIRALHETRDGALWLLTYGNGLVRVHDGRFERLGAADGLASDFPRGFHEDADGIVWIGSFGNGLTRLDRAGGRSLAAARLRVIRTRDGLPDDVVHQILEDDAGRLWIGSNRGIFTVRRADLNALAAGRLGRVHAVRYDEEQGMRSREVNGGGFPAGARTRDGRLWFPTQDGVAVIDPRLVQRDTILGVAIESVTAGDSVLPSAGEIRLASARRDVEIGYTAPTFVRAEHLRFRYRLDGWHEDWVEAGTRRTASFTNLPPGRYAFRVAATHGDGRWTELAAPLAVVVEPRVHETTAFRAALAAALLLAVVAGTSWRARAAAARARELERLVRARTAELAREKELTARQAESLVALDRAKDRFFANISHEFRTPLTLILGPLADLADGRHGALPPGARGQLGMMQRHAQRLLRLINQVLDLTRLESGALPLAPAPHDLTAAARAVTWSFSPLAERRGIALAFDGGAPAVVRLDVEQFEKVLLNLLSNAFKFTEPGGRVTVRVAAEDGQALLAVEDSGIGIPQALLPRVFDRFFQVDGSETRRHEGSGIGLSLAKELVELHGGTIHAASIAGAGSIFTVRLPLVTAPAEAVEADGAPDGVAPGWAAPVAAAHSADEPAGVEAGAGSGDGAAIADTAADDRTTDDRTTLLVVDDNADVRAYVASVLGAGYRVLEAGDGEAGLAVAREALPDLVLADVMMPRLDGFALARALREDPATDCIPVVLLTARVGSGSEVEGLGAGADDYLTKPFDRGVLEARIAALIATRRRLRERFRAEGLPPRVVVPEPVSPDLQAALPRSPSAVLVRLRAVVEANLAEPGFNPEALAVGAGLSYQQLYRRLRDELDVTPSEFIRTVRVERAAELLQAGAGTVTEVAYAVGFNSLSHFSRSFRERFGTPPTALMAGRS